MYTTCTFCYHGLGHNELLEWFPVAQRVAFDPAKGCLWAVCPACARWNLAPMAERWEAAEECERHFRGTALRYSSGNIGLAWLPGDVELIRIGAALRPEVASWRYGRVLERRRPLRDALADRAARLTSRVISRLAPPRSHVPRDARAIASRLGAMLRGNRVLDLVHLSEESVLHEGHVMTGHEPEVVPHNDSAVAVVRYRHLLEASLQRPESGRPWSLRIPHDHGVLAVAGDRGIQLAGRLLSVINGSERGGGFSRDMLEAAVAKVGDSALPDSYFNRVLAIAMRTRWGREGEPQLNGPALSVAARDTTQTERMALALTGRTFWGNGGIGSEPATALLDVPLVDRIALEMAAHEESERKALDGDLEALTAAWREADEIAAIADALLPMA